MKIIHIDNNPIGSFAYKNTGPRYDLNEDGSNKLIERYLPIQKGVFEKSAPNIDALIIASDLQGNVDGDGRSGLLGEHLAEYLRLLIESEFKISNQNTGVILAGDLYAPIDRRGGYGDVRKVYTSFRDAFRWVVGVNGNHDKIGVYKVDEPRFRKEENITILHKESKVIDDFNISGISGIIGNHLKPNRVEEDEYLTTLRTMLYDQPDLMVLHESPDFVADNFDGNEKIRQVIEDSPKNLIICGHRFWKEAWREYQNGSKVLNVNERVIVLIKQ